MSKCKREKVVRHFPQLSKLSVFLMSMFITFNALANPQGGVVTAGSATISQTPGNTQIQQTSDKAIIEWNSFNIKNGEQTNFQQPTGGIALNRINPNQGPSQIFGQLTATGTIVLVNQAGIFFGPTARVDVGGIIASTSDITNDNFMSGNYRFDQASSLHGSITNQGSIIARDNGLVALIGSNVSNEGYIKANLGNVVLASGDKFTVDLSGDGLINFAVDAPTNSTSQYINSVKNTGTIIADGGSVLITAKSASTIVDNVIDVQGIVQTRSVSEKNGEIILSGDPQSEVTVAANLDASGKNSDETGGTIKILGNNIHLQAPTLIDVSGYNGGGTVDIGGDFHGAGSDLNALTTIVDNGVTINANALMNGNGGNVAVWSNADTEFHGSISAQGGVVSGNGGFVETSGGYLNIAGATVNTLAPSGNTGTWLLDPSDVTIESNGGTDSNASYSGGIYSPTTGASSSIIDVGNLETDLSSSNVNVTTTSTGSGNGDIAVNSPITWSSSNTLTLTATRNIYINSDITATNGGLTLSAVNGAQSITGGTIGSGTIGGTVNTLTANINVANFTLSQGQWFQSATSLPTFSVSNNFQVTSGSTYNGNFAAQFTRINTSSGNGITDVFGLQGVATGPLNKNYVLSNNIDATVTSNWNSGKGFFSIGTGDFPTPANPYTGTFNGAGFTINNLFMNNNINNEGLFGYAQGATISNVGVTNATVKGSTGGLGILVGFNDGGTVSHSYTTGSAGSAGDSGNVYGGLVGSNNGDINNSYSTASVQTSNNYIGGLVGINGNNGNGTIETSFSTGAVTGNGSFQSVGGLVGAMNNTSSITDSYSTSPVTANSDFAVGGLVGNVIVTASTVATSYSTGYVTGNSQVGGLIGTNGGTGNITNSYWDTQTSGQSTSADGVGKTTAQLQSALQSGFSGSTWGIIAGDGSAANGSYPYLKGIYSSTPRVISGYMPGGSASATGLSGTSVKLSYAGSVIDTFSTGDNGFYYFLESNGTVANNNPFLVYLDSGSTKSNIVGLAPSSGASAVLLNMTANNIDIYGNTTAITNTNLGTAAGSSPSTNVLYTVSGANLTLGNTTNTTANLNTDTTTINNAGTLSTASTSYTIDGNISVNSGSSPSTSLNFAGPVNISGSSITTTGNQTYSGAVILGATSSLTSSSGNINLASTVNGGFGLTLSGNSITLGGVIGGTTPLTSIATTGSTTVNGSAINTSGNQTYNSALTIGAASSTFTATGNSTITLNSVSGNNLTLAGGSGSNSYILNGNLGLNNLTITGGSGSSNSLTLPGSGLTLQVSASSPLAGSVLNGSSQTIASYSNINSVTGNNLTAVLPTVATAITITGAGAGTIADPFNFNGIDNFSGNNATTVTFAPGVTVAYDPTTGFITVNGTQMTFSGVPASGFNINFNAQVASTISSAIASTTYQSTVTNNNSVNSDENTTDNTNSIGPAASVALDVHQTATVNQNVTQVNQSQQNQDVTIKNAQTFGCL